MQKLLRVKTSLCKTLKPYVCKKFLCVKTSLCKSPCVCKSFCAGRGDAHRLAPTEAKALKVSQEAVEHWLPPNGGGRGNTQKEKAIDSQRSAVQGTKAAERAEKKAQKKRLEGEKRPSPAAETVLS